MNKETMDNNSRQIISQASIEQSNTNPAASESLLVMSRENYHFTESDENSEDVNSTNTHSQPQCSSRKRRRSYRHTKPQIEAMEAFFNECPHPNKVQRRDLASKLGLDPIQVKFWFQNKRTHTKSRNARNNNQKLRAENEKLAAENLRCKHELRNVPCRDCGATSIVAESRMDLQQLRQEQKNLIEQVENMKNVTSKYVDKSIIESCLLSNASSSSSQTVCGNKVSEEYTTYLARYVESNEASIKDVATAAMGELIKKIEMFGEKIWIPNREGSGYVLNEDEYFKAFPTMPRRDGWRDEGSMQSAKVMASAVEVVGVYMDMDEWLAVYPNFVSRAKSFYQSSTIGMEGTEDSDLQLISAEFQVSCPIIPAREFMFMRYSKKLDQHIWAIVDVSLDSILPEILSDPSIKCVKRPSGCIIEESPEGFSKVTWVEHVVVNDEVVHHLVEPILQSGAAYGATRWMSILERQCERVGHTLAETQENSGGIVTKEGKRNMSVLKLSERMCREYFGGVTTSNAYGWRYVSGDGVDEVMIMKKNNANDTRIPSGDFVRASLCIQLPIASKVVFDFIRNKATRGEWDVLCKGPENFQEALCIVTGQEGNCVSVLQVHENEDRTNTLILQETNTELTSSSFIFAYFDMDSIMRLLSNDADLDKIDFLPGGFTILPTKLPNSRDGTLLTASFEILISPVPCENNSADSIDAVKSLVETTLQNINNALMERI